MPAGPEDELVHRGARRRSARYLLHGDVEITSPFEAKGFLFNASLGGMRMAIDRPVETGTVLEMRVLFDNQHGPAADRRSTEAGEVVWCRELPDGWLVGIRFVEVAA